MEAFQWPPPILAIDGVGLLDIVQARPLDVAEAGLVARILKRLEIPAEFVIAEHVEHLVADRRLCRKHLGGTAKVIEPAEELLILGAVGGHVLFGVRHDDAHRAARLQHAMALDQQFDRLAELQMLEKMLHMDMLNGTGHNRQPVKHVPAEHTGEFLRVDVNPTGAPELAAPDVEQDLRLVGTGTPQRIAVDGFGHDLACERSQRPLEIPHFGANGRTYARFEKCVEHADPRPERLLVDRMPVRFASHRIVFWHHSHFQELSPGPC
jgi:hypothetical protein